MKRFSLMAAILIVMAAISALAAPKPDTAKRPSISGHSGECTLCLRCFL